MSDSTFKSVVRELAAAFEPGTRTSDGAKYWRIKEDVPAWLQGSSLMLAVHAALDDRLPDDWVYEHARCVAYALVDHGCDDADEAREATHEIADSLVDVYTSARTAWLASHLGNLALVDEACSELGSESTDIAERIGLGQYYAIERIAGALIDACEHEADERDAGATDDAGEEVRS